MQDIDDNKVLMVAYMNKEALLRTIETKRTWFFSRSRKKLWMKGETSKNVQIVKEIYVDCDADCILVKVKQVGGASCHTGYRTCFFRKVISKNKIKISEKKVFDPKKVYKNV
ncbi:MAG: phosphoribosyl-AMP cyclohydrolase [Endomicrobiia bacterium]